MQQLIVGNPAILKLTLVLLLMTKQNRRLINTSKNEVERLPSASVDVWSNKPE